MSRDTRLTFSQREGYVKLPKTLRLGELPKAARTEIWNVLYEHLEGSRNFAHTRFVLQGSWEVIARGIHRARRKPLDEWDNDFSSVCREMRSYIESVSINYVFDLIEFIMRHSVCPQTFIKAMATAFAGCRLAYTIDLGPQPTILPATTPEEGERLKRSLDDLRSAGLDGCTAHLRKASMSINAGDWAGSVRESIHAVESVAKHIDPDGAKTLGAALNSLQSRGVLRHRALKEALSKLYGYTSDEQGIRHALLDEGKANVTVDEAVFFLGACASFASYLWRRHQAANTP